jgi:HD-GYP domain-containing protein (c-di-GMP phosphodiesterase class II)
LLLDKFVGLTLKIAPLLHGVSAPASLDFSTRFVSRCSTFVQFGNPFTWSDHLPSASDTSSGVNPHYLGHVMVTAESHVVAASEDIVAANGQKLLARGARIDPAVRERLLAYKLRKSLEDCVTVEGGVDPAQFAPLAEELLDQHTLLARLCGDGPPNSAALSLSKLFLSAPVRSLLNVYASSRPDRLPHAVGVALIAMGLARRVRPGDPGYHQMLGLAGLLHDVGELYIDPRHFDRDTPLDSERWRQIISHPLLGFRVLTGMAGAGPSVAQAVLLHHERLNGHGYPRSVMGTQLVMDGQIVGIAEWLMALVNSGLTPISRASVSAKLMPGEFHPELMNCLASAAPAAEEISWATATTHALLDEKVARLQAVGGVLDRFLKSHSWVQAQLTQDIGDCRPVLQTALQRMLILQSAFSSTGLDSAPPDVLLRELIAHNDPRLQLEVLTLVDELYWRLRDLERRAWQREVQLKPKELAVIRELVQRVKNG